MTPPNDMITWLRGVLDEMERLPGQFADYPETALAHAEAERGIIAAWEEQRDFNGDPEGKMAALTAVRWLAYGHRHDAPGWHQEWTPDSVHTPT